jgi:hypothetical protein
MELFLLLFRVMDFVIAVIVSKGLVVIAFSPYVQVSLFLMELFIQLLLVEYFISFA